MRGQINPSTKVFEVAQKKVSSMSSNGPSKNYCGALEVNLKTCAKGTKLRVYTNIDLTISSKEWFLLSAILFCCEVLRIVNNLHIPLSSHSFWNWYDTYYWPLSVWRIFKLWFSTSTKKHLKQFNASKWWSINECEKIRGVMVYLYIHRSIDILID